MSLPNAYGTLNTVGRSIVPQLIRKRRVSTLRTLLSSPMLGASAANRARLDRLRPLLASLLKSERERLLGSIGQLDVDSAVQLLSLGLGDPNALLEQALHTALWKLQHLPEDFLWDAPPSQLIDVQRGGVHQLAAAGYSIGPSGIEVQLDDGSFVGFEELARPRSHFFPVNEFLHFSTFDSNPLAMQETHPDKLGNATDLGGHTAEEWVDSLQRALSEIERWLPECWSELGWFMQRIVPVGYHPEKHLSASYTESIGLAYVSLHPDTVIMAEAIVHESQHSKLNMLMAFDPVLHNGRSTWTDSPVRPDLRPLSGVLLAAHAFVPVALMLKRMREAQTNPTIERRWQQVLDSNQRSLDTLQRLAQPTAIGKKVLNGLVALDHYVRH